MCDDDSWSWPLEACSYGGHCVNGTCVCSEGFTGNSDLLLLEGVACHIPKALVKGIWTAAFVVISVIFVSRVYTLWRELKYGAARRLRRKRKHANITKRVGWWHDGPLRLQVSGMLYDVVMFGGVLYKVTRQDKLIGVDRIASTICMFCPILWWTHFIIFIDITIITTAITNGLDVQSAVFLKMLKRNRQEIIFVCLIGFAWFQWLPIILMYTANDPERNLLYARVFLTGQIYCALVAGLIVNRILKRMIAGLDSSIEQMAEKSEFMDTRETIAKLDAFRTKMLIFQKKAVPQHVFGILVFGASSVIPFLTSLTPCIYPVIIYMGANMTVAIQYTQWISYKEQKRIHDASVKRNATATTKSGDSAN